MRIGKRKEKKNNKELNNDLLYAWGMVVFVRVHGQARPEQRQDWIKTMTIRSSVPMLNGFRSVVYNAAGQGCFNKAQTVYAMVIDEREHKFSNINSKCIVSKQLIGTANYGTAAHADLLEVAECACKELAALG